MGEKIKCLILNIILLPVYAGLFFLIVGHNGELVTLFNVPEIVGYFLIIIEMVGVVLLFNYRSYKKYVKYIENTRNGKIYKQLIAIIIIIGIIGSILLG